MPDRATPVRVAPRLLTKQEAAAYCGVSVPVFDQVCTVQPVALAKGRDRLLRYDVLDLDAWIDRRKRKESSSGPDAWLDRLGNDGRARERR